MQAHVTTYLSMDLGASIVGLWMRFVERRRCEMKVRLTAHRMELSAELRDYVTRRVHFGLGRFAGWIKSLTVRLADINGPRGGIDKCCHIRVDGGLSQKVIVREHQETIHAAVALAMERVERAVERQVSLTRPAARRSATRRADFQFGD
jgi:putative sigma-54 modulation protein